MTIVLRFKYQLLTLIYLGLSLGVFGQSLYLENKGQWPDHVAAKLSTTAADVWLETNGYTVVQWQPSHHDGQTESNEHHHLPMAAHTVKAKWVSSETDNWAGEKAQSALRNYFIGNNPGRWATGVREFEQIRLHNIYPGISALAEVVDGSAKLTYEVQPGADPSSIAIAFSGHRSLTVSEGSLDIATSVGTITETGLEAYQWVNGRRQIVHCQFIGHGDTIRFALGNYQRQLPLFIDPTIIASTNSGCTSEAFGHTATFNHHGHIYSAGRVFGTGYPTDTGAFQVDFQGPFTGGYYQMVDACVSKYSADGSQLLYATYLGGDAEDLPHSMIATADDHLVILGSSNSTDFPTSSAAFDTTHNGGKDIVITILNSTGSALVASTYLGGSSYDGVNNLETYYADSLRGEVVLDSVGNVYIASFSRSANFPTTANAYQTALAGLQDGVVCKLPADLSSLSFSTFLGGAARDAAYALRVKSNGEVCVTGTTASTAFPTTAGAASTTLSGATDGFVSVLNASGTVLSHSSLFGTTAADRHYFVDLGTDGSIYTYGTTAGSLSATAGHYAGPAGGSFVARWSPTLDSVEWLSTFGNMAPSAFLVDNCNRIYISGQKATSSIVMNTTTFDTLDPVLPLGGAGFYLMKLSPNAENLEFGSFYGNNGSHVDGGTSRFDKRGIVYQATCSNGNFPTTAWAYSTTNETNNATYDNTVFKIDFEMNQAEAQLLPADTGCAPFVVSFNNTGTTGSQHFWDFGNGQTSTDTAPTATFSDTGTYTVLYIVSDTLGCYGFDTATIGLTVVAPNLPTITVGDTHCVDSVIAWAPGGYLTYEWSTGSTNDTITIGTSGVVSLTVSEALFCENNTTAQIILVPPFQFTLNDTAVCDTPFTWVGPADADSFLWGNGSTAPQLAANAPGTYTLTAWKHGCPHSTSAEATVAIVRFQRADTTVCADSLLLTAFGGAALWSNGQTTDSLWVSQSGTYWATANTGLCVSSDTVLVNFSPDLIELPDTFRLCEPDTIKAAWSGIPPAWSNGTSGGSTVVQSSGTYWVEVQEGSCTEREGFFIDIVKLLFNATDTSICARDSAWIVPPRTDALLEIEGIITDSVLVNKSTTLNLTISAHGCKATDTLHLRFVADSANPLPPDTALCEGETWTLPPEAKVLAWHNNQAGNTLTVSDSGAVWVQYEIAGCIFSDTTWVHLKNWTGVSETLLANVMTPNGDGLNDLLTWHGPPAETVTDYHLKVFNRWGVVVFETLSPSVEWDGNLPSGEAATEGTYFIEATGTTECLEAPQLLLRDHVWLVR